MSLFLENKNTLSFAFGVSRIKRNTLQLLEIIFWYLPTAFAHSKKHYEFYKVLHFYRKNNLIGRRTYRAHLFTYVSKGLSINEKLITLTHHYSFLKKVFGENFLKELFSKGLLCWEENGVDANFHILLKANHYEFEGSLTLLFKVNEKSVFSLNFSFVPGKIFGFKNKKTILFISGLKGVGNEFSNITLISKYFYGMSPRIILMKVAECIAVSLEIDTILAVSVDRQVSFGNKDLHQTFRNNYDNFWEKIQGVKLENGYYYFKCPLDYKPIDLVKGKYRRRARKRRKKLDGIFNKGRCVIADYRIIKEAARRSW